MTSTLPRAGLAFGLYPERRPTSPPTWLDVWREWTGAVRDRRIGRMPSSVMTALDETQRLMVSADASAARALRADVQAGLSRDGFAGPCAGRAIGLACAAMQRTLGLVPYPTQQFAAWLMLQGGLAEMATGEGKTVAIALAAGAAGLAGVPVHVLTANDYLVARDAAAMAPYYAALGIASGAIIQSTGQGARRALYRRGVLYITARELGFDYLRDHHRLGEARSPLLQRALEMNDAGCAGPLVPSLCLALVDEADSLLLDEACVPLILARAGRPLDQIALRRAFDIAGALVPTRDFSVQRRPRLTMLTESGKARVAAAVDGERGLLWPLRRACDLVQSALVAQLLLRREIDYTVSSQGLALIDELTGRIAQGRQWSGELHAMVQIKEGLAPSLPAETAAQITYQRLFPRYLHLAGMSGTLHESRSELHRLYRCRTAVVPLARPSQRLWLGRRLFISESAKWKAVCDAVRTCLANGRPVLIGTDSVGASERLSAHLQKAGVAHQVLNASQSEDEARCIARAGNAGCVTVTTNIAGRGTDIELDAQARAAGGLHVIAASVNRARRIDRQLYGRAARHGDPGSFESIVALDDALLVQGCPTWLRSGARLLARDGRVPGGLGQIIARIVQRCAEQADADQRQLLRRMDHQAEERFAFAGQRE